MILYKAIFKIFFDCVLNSIGLYLSVRNEFPNCLRTTIKYYLRRRTMLKESIEKSITIQ